MKDHVRTLLTEKLMSRRYYRRFGCEDEVILHRPGGVDHVIDMPTFR